MTTSSSREDSFTVKDQEMKKTKSKSLKKKKKKKKVGELDEVLNKTDPRGKDIQEVLET